MECLEDTEEGQKDATILSPVGVWYFTMATDRYRGQALASWAKKTAMEFFPDAAPKDRRLYLTLDENGEVPEYPAKFSGRRRSEEHTSELQSLMRISYAVFCFKTI